MTNLNMGKKQLGRALAVVMTVGSLLGVIASPAMAIDGEVGGDVTYNLEVDVTNAEFCEYSAGSNSPASWAPNTTVVNYDNNDNTVDAFDTTQTVGFNVDLAFEKGNDSGGCLMEGTINPSGDVFTSFTSIDALVMDTLDCSDVSGCSASNLLNNSSSLINGVLNVGSSPNPGLRSGSLTVQWVPSESNAP